MNFIPPQDEGRLRAAASGVLPNGKAVVVNADGTVSVVSETSQSLGATVDITQQAAEMISAGFDTNSNRVLFAYADNSNSFKGTAIVGTVDAANQTISFGTAVVFFDASNFSTDETAITFDTSVNKFVIFYIPYSSGGDRRGRAKVATVDSSDNSVTFGSEATYHNAITAWCAACFDSNSNKHVVGWSDGNDSDKGYVAVGTISGTDISFGSDVKFYDGAEASLIGLVFDSSNNKVVVVYRDNGNSYYGTAIVGTVSGTSISFGSAVVYNSAGTHDNDPIFDTNANKVVIFFKDGGDSDHGHGIVGTVSGTSISFGTKVEFEGATTQYIKATFDNSANKTVVSYRDSGNSGNLTFAVGTVSGTSISFETPVPSSTVVAGGNTNAITFDSNAKQVVTCFKNDGSGDDFGYMLFQNASTTLTAENYIGMSGGAVKDLPINQAIGNSAVFEADALNDLAATFDSSSNKVVMVYRSSPNYGWASVGTVSGTSISFGTPVTFTASGATFISTAFDTNSSKVVIAYTDGGNQNYGTAIVGTVSGTSISFGSPVVFESAGTDHVAAGFDSSNNKVVISYTDTNNSYYGTAIVGTISGTAISFGSPVVFNSGSTTNQSISFDSNSGKVVIAYATSSNGSAIVGTVSGTAISFGSASVFYSANAVDETRAVFDSNSNKIVIPYQDSGNSDYGTAVVGTVSGTDITFGTPVVFEAAATSYISSAFDSNVNKAVITYRDGGNSGYGTLISGTVSGTTISFSSPAVFEDASIYYTGSTFDSNSNKVVTGFDVGSDGTGVVIQVQGSSLARGQVASGSSASVDIIGTVSENQNALTAGQSYFVQTDGTIGLTAGSPSVFAGTAISATKLLVKT